jgi:hypothetical protein
VPVAEVTCQFNDLFCLFASFIYYSFGTPPPLVGKKSAIIIRSNLCLISPVVLFGAEAWYPVCTVNCLKYTPNHSIRPSATHHMAKDSTDFSEDPFIGQIMHFSSKKFKRRLQSSVGTRHRNLYCQPSHRISIYPTLLQQERKSGRATGLLVRTGLYTGYTRPGDSNAH